MSVIDKVIAAVTPPESDEARAKARERARACAAPGDWLATVLDHHLQVEAAFDAVAAAADVTARRSAQKKLGLLLTAHSIAEESVIYPAMAIAGERAHAEKAYVEQSAAKMEMAALDELDPTSEDYQDKLEHIRGAVTHHVYEEEGTWFPELAQAISSETAAKLSARFADEFDRYLGKSKL